jgi:hypothetical protein
LYCEDFVFRIVCALPGELNYNSFGFFARHCADAKYALKMESAHTGMTSQIMLLIGRQDKRHSTVFRQPD